MNFQKEKPKIIAYRDYKDLAITLFAMTLKNAVLTQRTSKLSRRLYSAFLIKMRR